MGRGLWGILPLTYDPGEMGSCLCTTACATLGKEGGGSCIPISKPQVRAFPEGLRKPPASRVRWALSPAVQRPPGRGDQLLFCVSRPHQSRRVPHPPHPAIGRPLSPLRGSPIPYIPPSEHPHILIPQPPHRHQQPGAVPSPYAPLVTRCSPSTSSGPISALRPSSSSVRAAAAAAPPARRHHAARTAKKPPANGAGVKPGKCRSLEEALKALDLADLQKELDKSQSVFPGNPSVWVKDLAGYLNYKLQAPRSDPLLSQHPHDYPYCLLSKPLRSIIRSLLGRAAGVLELFFDHCIYTMLQELDKTPGESLHGYRICIQALLLDRPRIATMNLGKYLEVLRSHQNRPAKCLTVLWALGQAGYTDLHEGLKVWLGVMLPVLGIKALSPYAVAYLDRLLRVHPNLTKGFGMIGPKDFFPLLDFAFMPNNSLTPSLQEQLQQLYPRLKVLAFGAKPEAALHTYFPSFLSRATPSCPPSMKKELLTSLSQCLSMDPLSFSVWRQLYTKHLSQSSLLLNHLLESWDSSSKKVQQALQDTVCSFKVTNEELAARGPKGDPDVAACNAACKELLCRMKGQGFAWSRLLLLLLLLCTSGFLLHDLRTHGSFQASSSAALLRSCGVLPAGQRLWGCCLEGYRWLAGTLPVHGSQAAALLQPRLEQLWAHSAVLAQHLSQQCCSLLSWLQHGLPRLAEWLQSWLPESLLLVAEWVWELLVVLVRSCLLPLLQGTATALERGWQRWGDSCGGSVSWDCVGEQLAGITYSSWIYLHNTTLTITNWALAAISGL